MSFLAQRCRETLVEYEGKQRVRLVRLGRAANPDLYERVCEVLRKFATAMDEGKLDTTPDSLYIALVDEIDGKHSQPADEFPPLDQFSARIVRALRDKHPELLTAFYLSTDTGISLHTTKGRLSKLEDADLVHKPEGRNQGAGLTPKGLKLAAALPDPDPRS